LCLSLLRTAWVCDDAYITFRTADNIIHGYGAVYNPGERVQGYTHPLWLGLFTSAYAATGEGYITAIVLSLVLSIAAIVLLTRDVALTRGHVLAAFAALLSSKAFIDYSTSGLENPLTHVLLVVFLWKWWTLDGEARPGILWFIAALCLLNRLDLGLLMGPALIVDAIRHGGQRTLRGIVLGVTPLLLWEVFSTIYYGSPVSNTAYAKLGTGIPMGPLLRQGWAYFVRSLRADPATIVTIALAPLASSARRWREEWPLVMGVVLYAAYILAIGGDFMLGRFFAAPFVWSVAILARARWRNPDVAGILIASSLIVIGLSAQWEPALLSGFGFSRVNNLVHGERSLEPRDGGRYLQVQGISDERRFYFEATGLLKQPRRGPRPNHVWAFEGAELRSRGQAVDVSNSIGFRGYFAGPGVHLVDVYGLADPLLARLPACPDWRIGHFRRALPDGYVDTLSSGVNRLTDPDVKAYYDLLRSVVAGPVWQIRRLRLIPGLLLGRYDAYLRRYGERIGCRSAGGVAVPS
jgi:arabinofuranosyltransferase